MACLIVCAYEDNYSSGSTLQYFITPRHSRQHYDEYDKKIGIEIFSLIISAFVRSTIEHTLARLKNFHILSSPFRHHTEDKHHLIFNIICKLVNHSLDTEPV